MIKKIFKIVKKIVIAGISIYGYNLIAAPLALVIPVNVLTVGIVSVLGIPSLIALIVLSITIF